MQDINQIILVYLGLVFTTHYVLLRGQNGQDLNKTAKKALYLSPDYQTSLNQLAFQFKRSSILIFKMAAILDFQSERFYLLLIYVISLLPMNFESIALLVQEKKFKIDFQHGC